LRKLRRAVKTKSPQEWIAVSGPRNAVSSVVGAHTPNAFPHHDAYQHRSLKEERSLDFFATQLIAHGAVVKETKKQFH
jgi:hypothetical protein